VTKSQGIFDYRREDPGKRPVGERLTDFAEFELALSPEILHRQSARCMDCGVPFCHSYGCPLHNYIPEWIEMAHLNRWREALDFLHATNNFPEITGRICPAPCETACTLAIHEEGVVIRHIELQIVERGFREGWIGAESPIDQTEKKVAIIGSGPAGLAAAQQLARQGHQVTVYEKSDQIGGLLRYGIPDFKLDKAILDRRIHQMVAEGVLFEAEVEAGIDLSTRFLLRSFDAIVLTHGAGVPRDLDVPGRPLPGVHFAVPYLVGQNRHLSQSEDILIFAKDKRVVVIGGGDTGSDCIGSANRQGAVSVTQIEILPEPPTDRFAQNPWPTWPNIKRTTSSQEEGCTRLWNVATRQIIEKDGVAAGLRCAKVEWIPSEDGGKPACREVPGSEFELEADLILLAMGFLHGEHGPLVHDMNLALDEAENIVVDETMMTSTPGVFAAGDAVTGPSLVVRAIHSGRQAAESVDRFLSAENENFLEH